MLRKWLTRSSSSSHGTSRIGSLRPRRTTLAVIGGTGRYRHAPGTLTLGLLDERDTCWTFALAR